jgi:hypothetical protein
LISAAEALLMKPRRLNTNNAEFVDEEMVQFAAEYDDVQWNDKLAKINNLTQYGFNDYLNSGKYESIAQRGVNASTEFKRMMRQLDQEQKNAEEQLEEDTATAEKVQPDFNQLQKNEANERSKEIADGADYAVEGDAAAVQVRDMPGAVQIETEAIEHMKNQEMFAEGTHNLLSSYFAEGDAAEATIEKWNEGSENILEPKKVPESKPVLAQKKTVAKVENKMDSEVADRFNDDFDASDV